MTSQHPEKEFEQELESFRREIETGINALFAYLAIHATAVKNSSVRDKLDTTPYFWRTVLYSLQSTQFIALGRIFDNKSPHTVHRLLKLAQENPEIFSKDALAVRKRAGSDNADEWLPQYLKTVHEPDATDFRRLRQHVRRRKIMYEGAYRVIRHKVFAHREITDHEEVQALFKKTTVDELKEIFIFLSKLYQALWELYHNGKKPLLRQQLHSVKKLLAKQSKPWSPKTAQELIVKDTQFLLENLIECKERPTP